MGFFGDNFEDPRTQGILQAAAAMLGSRGQNFGQSLGAGLQAGIGGYGDAQKIQSAMLMKKAEDAMKQKLMESQIAENESQNQQRAAGIKKQEQLNNLLMSRFGGQQQAPVPQMQGQPNSDIAQSIPLDAQSSGMPQQQVPAISQGQPQQQAGKFPFSVNDLAALKAMGGPDLLDILKYANAGDKRESGSYYTNPMDGKTIYMPKLPEGTTMGPDGRAMIVPGAADANATYQGKQAAGVAAGQSGYKLKERYDAGSGQMVMDTEGSIINQAQGGKPAVAGPRAGDTTYNTELAKSAADTYKVMQTAGMQAPSKIAKYQRMGQLLQGFEGGKLSGVGLDLARVGNSLGMKIDKNLSNKEAAKALAIELANGMREPGTGVMTDKDFENFLAATPQLGQSAAGRQTIIDTYVKKLQRDQEVAKMASKYQQRYSRIDAPDPTGKTFQDYLGDWYASHPVYGK